MARALHDELRARDPDAAQAIERNNGRRIVRALEVIELTGEPFVARLPPPEDVYPVHRFGVHIDRDRLDSRIEGRVNVMWNDGFVDEVRQLEASGFRDARQPLLPSDTDLCWIFLAGECSEEQARQRTIEDTRKFARRQQRWFLRDERIEWHNHMTRASLMRSLVALRGVAVAAVVDGSRACVSRFERRGTRTRVNE